jgi:alkyl sulfatase BDS1-like metallo-beta-lactamase superfamily hydrolase
MGEASVRFFDDLAARGRHLLPPKWEGSIRFDLTDRERTDHWLLEIRHGDVTISRDIRPADVTMHVKHDLFDKLVTGEESWVPLVIRGAFEAQGKLRLLTEFRKLFPGQPGAHHPRDFARARRQPR